MREYLDVPLEIKTISEDGTFSGYGSVFGELDSYKEVVAKGAFAKSLATRKPALLWQHRSTEPIGVYTEVKEDDHGLFVTGKLAMKTTRGAEAYELLKMGAVSGLSIGFISINDSYDKKTGIRTLSEVDLWEVSPVTFPACESARVSAVKAIEDINTLADAERYLRDAGGLSRSQATGLLSRVKSIGQGEPDWTQLTALIERRGNAFKI